MARSLEEELVLYPPRGVDGKWGITYQVIGEKLYIVGKTPGSPAASSGKLQNGDLILSFNGVDVRTTSLNDIKELFKISYWTNQLKLDIRHDHKKRSFNYLNLEKPGWLDAYGLIVSGDEKNEEGLKWNKVMALSNLISVQIGINTQEGKCSLKIINHF